MRGGSLDDVDPTVKRWVARKYEEGASREEIKAELEGNVEDLSVVDRIIDSGAVQRDVTVRDDLFSQGFPTVWLASVRGTLSMGDSYFGRIAEQPSYQAVGIVLANTAAMVLVSFLSSMVMGPIMGGPLVGREGLMSMAYMAAGLAGMGLLFAVVSGVVGRMIGGRFDASFNTAASLTALWYMFLIPFLGFLLAVVIAPFLYYGAITEANGFSFWQGAGMVVIVGIVAVAASLGLAMLLSFSMMGLFI